MFSFVFGRRRKHVLPCTLGLFLALPLALTAQAQPPDKAEAMAATINRHLAALWQQHQVQPAPLAEDTEFLRRVYLDLAGRIPSLNEARAFLADNHPEKRHRLLDHLMNQPEFRQQLARMLREYLLPEAPPDLESRATHIAFEMWVEEKLKQKKGLDEIARLMITAPGIGRNRGGMDFGQEQAQALDSIFVTTEPEQAGVAGR